jgi:hypothetical protein
MGFMLVAVGDKPAGKVFMQYYNINNIKYKNISPQVSIRY